jgi:hypothetical protein
MAFGISRTEMNDWKQKVSRGVIAFLTHYWIDERFPEITTVTKAGCSNITRLRECCFSNGLNPRHIHHRTDFPHFDLIGYKQKEILEKEQLWEQIARFRL